jgi:anhydro-N-acetylmuramic acid kinase
MSGTSADGIDAAIVSVDGAPPRLSLSVRAFTCVPLAAAQRERIFALFDPRTGTVDRICEMNFRLGEWFAAAALQAIAEAGLHREAIDLIGSHGQTIYHAAGPDAAAPATLQIGEPAVIAARTGVTTVADFRVADVAVGGQGAPLVSYVDWLLLRHPTRPRAIQNIGGIANVTYLPSGDDPGGVVAFDTGPGNMLIDDAVVRATGGDQRYDHDGALAASGAVNEDLLAELLAHPYLSAPPPKTTGREQFGRSYGGAVWDRAQAHGTPGRDIVATLTALTAVSIAEAYRRFLPDPPEEVILGGGGARNSTLVRMLREALAPSQVLTHEALGMSSEAKEAVAFAVLAYEALHGRPGNLPGCTGAHSRTVLGKLVPGRNYARLLARACLCDAQYTKR